MEVTENSQIVFWDKGILYLASDPINSIYNLKPQQLTALKIKVY